jgi:hypothetical protein
LLTRDRDSIRTTYRKRKLPRIEPTSTGR